MPHGVILKYELARERRIGVERHRRGLIEFLVAQSSDCRRRCRAVAPEQIQRPHFRDGVVLLGVFGVHLVYDTVCERLSEREAAERRTARDVECFSILSA